MKARVYFHHFDSKKINGDPRGWGAPYARLKLRLTDPLEEDGKGINALDEAFDQYHFVAEIDVKRVEESYAMLQNGFECHPYNDRSMYSGDVVIFVDTKEGYFCEPEGWSKLTKAQVERFLTDGKVNEKRIKGKKCDLDRHK